LAGLKNSGQMSFNDQKTFPWLDQAITNGMANMYRENVLMRIIKILKRTPAVFRLKFIK